MHCSEAARWGSMFAAASQSNDCIQCMCACIMRIYMCSTVLLWTIRFLVMLLQVEKTLSKRVGDKRSCHNEQHDEDKRAVELYAEELREGMEDGNASPHFYLIEDHEVVQPELPDCHALHSGPADFAT